MVTAPGDDKSATISASHIEEVVEVVRPVGAHSSSWAARVDDWEFYVRHGDGHAWGGLVLSPVTRLEILNIEILSSQGISHLSCWDVKRYAVDPVERLFGSSQIPQRQSIFLPWIYPHYPVSETSSS
jgi:hypothetical protein